MAPGTRRHLPRTTDQRAKCQVERGHAQDERRSLSVESMPRQGPETCDPSD